MARRRGAPGPLPSLVVIGAYKSATTSFYHYLGAHPDVFMCPVKEPNYFTKEWSRGEGWYRALFTGADAPVVGEASTTYSRWPLFEGASERIGQTLPDAKLVYLMRHPVDRIVAQFRYDVFHYGYGGRPDDTILELEDHYLATSKYAMQVHRYLRFFDRQQLLLLTTEELRRDRAGTMARVFDFLGVAPLPDPRVLDQEFNRAEEQRSERALLRAARRLPGFGLAQKLTPKRFRQALWSTVATRGIGDDIRAASITDETRALLAEQLREDLEQLRELMGAGFDCWSLL
jgi:hypothetical protein